MRAPHKAFAISQTGAFGFSYGQRTVADAEVRAIENCTKHTPLDIPCTIAVIDDEKTKNWSPISRRVRFAQLSSGKVS